MAKVTKRKWKTGGVEKEAWQVRHVDQGGAPRCRQFASKRDAFAFVRDLEAEKVAAAAPKTFNDLCDAYLVRARQLHLEGLVGDRRLASITAAFKNRVAPGLGQKLAEAITPADIEDYHDELMRGGTLHSRSARVQLEYLLLVERQANKRDHMLSRPVTAAMRDLRAVPREKIRTFKLEEVLHVLECAATRPPRAGVRAAARMECFVNVAAFCGLRRGEIAALTLDSVLFDERVIEVRQNLTDRRVLKRPKTRNSRRDVPLPPRVAELLRSWIADHHRPNPHGLLFTGRDGGVMDVDAVNTGWVLLLARAGLTHEHRPFHFHALRHFYASLMIEAGTPLPDAAILLGHRSFDETLQTYTHSLTAPAVRHDFVARMAERFAAPALPSLPAPTNGGTLPVVRRSRPFTSRTGAL